MFSYVPGCCEFRQPALWQDISDRLIMGAIETSLLFRLVHVNLHTCHDSCGFSDFVTPVFHHSCYYETNVKLVPITTSLLAATGLTFNLAAEGIAVIADLLIVRYAAIMA